MDNLNKEQQFVVDCLEENILLMAPAGTGKTNTLSLRIDNIVKCNRAEPREILCLTFTNKAAMEMAERVVVTLGLGGREVVVKTIHSFCLELIKENLDYCDQLSAGFSILDEEDVIELLFDIFGSKYKKKLSRLYLTKVAMALELLAKTDVYLNDTYKKAELLFESMEERLKNDICLDENYNYYHNFYMFLNDNLGELAQAYEERKRRANVADFTDLIVLAYRLLEDESILKAYKERFKFIHVDEMQDVSYFEYRLMEQLFEGNMVLMCGDVCQTIYEWRGSIPKVILKAYEDCYHPVVVDFVTNYRSTRNILEGANGFLKKALGAKGEDGDFKSSVSVLDWGEKISIRAHSSVYAEARWIMDEIKAIGLDDRSKVAILCRGNAQNTKISQEIGKIIVTNRYYKDKTMNFFLADEFRLFRRKEIKIALNFLKLYRKSNDESALRYILSNLDYKVGAKVIETLTSDETRVLGVGLTDFIAEKAMREGDYYAYLDRALEKESLIVFDVEATGVDVFSDDIIQIAAIKINEKNQVIESFERFLIPRRSVGASYEVHGFSDEFLKTNGEPLEKVLKEFLDFVKGSVVVGHNLFFDLSITRVNLHRCELPPLDIEFWYDTLDISRRTMKQESYRLGYLVEKLGLESQPNHNAMNDILATGELLLYLKNNYLDPKKSERQKLYGEFKPNFKYISYAYNALMETEGRAKKVLSKIYELSNIYEIFKNEEGRLKNLGIFLEVVDNLDDKNYDISSGIGKLLEYTALSNSQMDLLAAKEEKIPIITVHQSKGLEYDYIFLASVNGNVFPSYRSVKDNKLLEEMKLFYVAMTRAKKKLYISSSGKPSEFVDMIPKNNIENGDYV